MSDQDIQPFIYGNGTGMDKGLEYTTQITIKVSDSEQFDAISKQILSKYYLGWERCRITHKLLSTPFSVRKYRKGSVISKYHGIMKPLASKHIHRVGYLFKNIEGEDLMTGELLDMKLRLYIKMLMRSLGNDCKPKDVKTEEVANMFTVQLLEAMEYLHKRNIAHGSLNYEDVYVSRDALFAVNTYDRAHLKLRLDQYESAFESYNISPIAFGSLECTLPDARSVTASVADDCGHIVQFLRDLRRDLLLHDTPQWIRFQTFLSSQKYVDMALIMRHEGLWSLYVQMRFLRTLAPLWASHVNKQVVRVPPFNSWVQSFKYEINIMNGALLQKAMRKKWYKDTLEGFSLMGKNALQHFNECNQKLAPSVEEFFELLILFDDNLIPKLINVANQLNLMETIMREICS